MDTEKIVRLVTEEVMRRLALAQPNGQPAGNPAWRILALFCGGAAGLETALTELAAIAGSFPAIVTAVLSYSAEQVIGRERVKASLGEKAVVLGPAENCPANLLSETDLVIIPVLTRNTAGKIAAAIADTPITALVAKALLTGKPILAAMNAANPYDPGQKSSKPANPPVNYIRRLEANLRTIEGYGIRLADAENLTGEARRLLRFAGQQRPGSQISQRELVSAEIIKDAYTRGEKCIRVTAGAMITPLAADVAGELGVTIVRT